MNAFKEIADLIVVGGGAAGFFGAIQAAEKNPLLKIIILEKSNRILSKVRISGGGRCNVTHHCFNAFELAHHYPRGEKQLKEIFKSFQAKDMVDWLGAKGVALKVEPDGRMFPTSDNSQTIIDCFIKLTSQYNIKIHTGMAVESVQQEDGDLLNVFCNNNLNYNTRKLLITVGGNPNIQFYSWIQRLGHTIHEPLPSLFTFNDSVKQFTDLMGVAVQDAEVRIAKTKYVQRGPLLITHWGLSGPAVIKLSAWAANYLHEQKYNFTVFVSWVGHVDENEFRNTLIQLKTKKPKQKVVTNPMFGVPARLWEKLCSLAEIEPQKIWGELRQHNLNKFLEFLIRCPFQIKGKTTFKDEFVTCGGIALNEIDLKTMESKKIKNVFFAGEVLNIDGETGGFNFQSAWSTAYLAAKGISNNI